MTADAPRCTELDVGTLVTYHGLSPARSMQRARIIGPRTDAFVAIRFADGIKMLVARRHVTRVKAVQWEPDF